MCGGSGGSKGGGGGGPSLPQDLTKMTKQQAKDTVDYLVKNKSYDELRKAQRLVEPQQIAARKQGNTQAWKNLEIMHKIYTRAIDKQAFGD